MAIDVLFGIWFETLKTNLEKLHLICWSYVEFYKTCIPGSDNDKSTIQNSSKKKLIKKKKNSSHCVGGCDVNELNSSC